MRERNSILRQILPSLLSGMAGVLISSYLVWTISMRQINEAHKNLQGQLIIELNRDFSFNERLYKVRKCIEDDKHILLKSGCNLNPQDIDNYLGLFELMVIYEEHGILDTKLADDSFGVYVEDAYKNKEIQQFIVETRKAYKGVVYLSPADKYPKLTRRPSKGQKGLDERVIMASQWPSHPW